MIVYWKYIYDDDNYAIWERDTEARKERYIYAHREYDPSDVGEWEEWTSDTIEQELNVEVNAWKIIEITKEEAFLEMI